MVKINSDIFREYDIRGKYPQDIDKKMAYQIGRAFALALKAKKVAVGRDRRAESSAIMPDFVKGILAEGCLVYNVGVCSTPSLSFTVGTKKLDGGAIITASHNPKGWTGLKLYGQAGVPLGLKTGLKDIIAVIKSLPEQKKIGVGKAKSKKLNITREYYQFIVSKINQEKIKSMRLVLDVSGGSGDGIVDYVFDRITAQDIQINFRPGDKYPDHGPNPLLPKSQKVVKKTIVKEKADLGVIWDGDADRAIFVDERGRFIHPYYINCLLSKIVLAKKPKSKILIDARMPVGPAEVIKKYGGQPIVSRAGTANIIKAMLKREILFGCENSGHYFFNFKFHRASSRNYVYSGCILPVLLVLEYLAEQNISLSEAVEEFQNQYIISGELNFKINDFKKLKSRLRQSCCQGRTQEIDGFSVYGQEGFFNVRPSHTEPLVRLNIEAKSKASLVKIKKTLLKIIK